MNGSKLPEKKDSLNTMEVGRFEERLKELIKIIPGTLRGVAEIWVLALKSLGTPQEEISRQLKEVMDTMEDRANDARERADDRFEKKIVK